MNLLKPRNFFSKATFGFKDDNQAKCKKHASEILQEHSNAAAARERSQSGPSSIAILHSHEGDVGHQQLNSPQQQRNVVAPIPNEPISPPSLSLSNSNGDIKETTTTNLPSSDSVSLSTNHSTSSVKTIEWLVESLGIADDECAICLDEISKDKRSYLPCSHYFHEECVSSAMSVIMQNGCPLCRIPVYSNEEDKLSAELIRRLTLGEEVSDDDDSSDESNGRDE